MGKTTKGEIDFVAVKDGKKEYYQVAYLLATEDVIEREFGAYKDIQDNYPSMYFPWTDLIFQEMELYIRML